MILPSKEETAAIGRGRADFKNGRSVYPGALLDATAGSRRDDKALHGDGALLQALTSLQSDHFAGKAVRVKGHPNTWCRIVGKYRIFYDLNAAKGELQVLTITPDMK